MLGTALDLLSACKQSANRKVTEGWAPEYHLLKCNNRPYFFFTHLLHPIDPTATQGSTWWTTPISHTPPSAWACIPQGRGLNTWHSDFWNRSCWQDHECARANRSARQMCAFQHSTRGSPRSLPGICCLRPARCEELLTLVHKGFRSHIWVWIFSAVHNV